MAMGDGYTLQDIAAATGNNDGGWGGNDNGWMWLIVLFLLVGGWGGRGFGGNQGGGGDGMGLYPWLNQAQTGWQGVSDIQNALCGGRGPWGRRGRGL